MGMYVIWFNGALGKIMQYSSVEVGQMPGFTNLFGGVQGFRGRSGGMMIGSGLGVRMVTTTTKPPLFYGTTAEISPGSREKAACRKCRSEFKNPTPAPDGGRSVVLWMMRWRVDSDEFCPCLSHSEP